jgi:DNA-binding NarL/FixJ family response regulator
VEGFLSLIRTNEPIRVGLLTEEPLHIAGLGRIFEFQPSSVYASLTPVFGNFEELLSDPTLTYVLVDLNAFPNGVETVEAIRRRRPDMRLMVIGLEGNDSLIMDLILAGARAYLDLKVGPRIVRQAVGEVTSGSIWAPRRLLALLIDGLLAASESSLTNAPARLTDRERQMLDLILTARSNRMIAHELGIEEHTVQAHVGRLLRKTGAENRIDLLMQASNPALLAAAGIQERRQGDRRRSDRRQGLDNGSSPVTHK